MKLKLTLFISIASALIAAAVPLSASASYLPDYPEPTFANVTNNMHELAYAYQAPAVAMVTHIVPMQKPPQESAAAPNTPWLAYVPGALFESVSNLSDNVGAAGVAYAHGLLWVGDLQAHSYQQAGALALAWDGYLEDLHNSQMSLYQTVGDTLADGISRDAAAAVAATNGSLWGAWTSLLSQAYYTPPSPSAASVGQDIVVAAYTIVVPIKAQAAGIAHEAPKVYCTGDMSHVCVTKAQLTELVAQSQAQSP